MKTKIVYVLTCSPENYYIEQAYISIFSARYHNPDAFIVLIVDQKTDTLFIGHRADLLGFISEKIVIEAPDEYTPLQSSRWIKTRVRNIIDGDYIFIDCDTIVTGLLEEVDSFKAPICAVLDCHLHVSEFPKVERNNLLQRAASCGWDFSRLNDYFSSGVMYVKDLPQTKEFYKIWNNNWLLSFSKGIYIDQIALAATNLSNNCIKEISGIWNCIMSERPIHTSNALIIHFLSLDNLSFLFSKRVLNIIKEKGLTPHIIKYILNPTHSFFPYLKQDFVLSRFFKTLKWVAVAVKEYGRGIDKDYTDLIIKSRINVIVKSLYKHKLYYTPTLIWMLWIKCKHKCK